MPAWVKHELDISNHTAVDWFNFIHDICKATIDNDLQQLGGFTEDGMSITVKINESKFYHQKYHQDQ